jgi:hypothetical protein
MTGHLRGQLLTTGTVPANAYVVWYKGGRLQITQRGQVVAGAPLDFDVWTAEPGGWIGILLDSIPDSSVEVRVNSSTLTP